MLLKFANYGEARLREVQYETATTIRTKKYGSRKSRQINHYNDLNCCLNCYGNLTKAFSAEHEGSRNAFFAGFEIRECENCGWWLGKRYLYDFEADPQINSSILLYSLLKTYPQTPKHQPTFLEITNELNKNPNKVYSMSAKNFELYSASLLASYFGCKVEHVGRRGDGGVDAYLLHNDSQTIVQCKRREKSGKVEKIETVRCLVSTMYKKDIYKGIIVSTADKFTKGCVTEVNDFVQANKIEKIELHDCNKFFHTINLVSSKKSNFWKPVISKYWKYK